MTILTTTTNFFDLYRHISGDSETPPIFNFWACTSMLSAVVQNRVWFEKYRGERLFPNLYIILVGPSGTGKGLAISQAVRLCEQSVYINKYRGKLTFAHLIDHLGKPIENDLGFKTLPDVKLWLIMDELKNDIGSGLLVEDFIGFMTEAYTATNYILNTGTRTSGKVDLDRPLINWFAGTTQQWLLKVLTPDTVLTGFPARCCFIYADDEKDIRKPRIQYPSDYKEVYEHLKARLYCIACQKGKFVATQTAEAKIDQWYHERVKPEEESQRPSWRRQHSMLIRFAMINTLADGGPLVIQHKHVVRSIAMINTISGYGAKVLDAASATRETRDVDEVARWIKLKGTIKHSDLTRAMHRKGQTSFKVKCAITDLLHKDKIERDLSKSKAQVYKWKKE